MRSLLFQAKGLRMLCAAATLFFWNHCFNEVRAQVTYQSEGFNNALTLF